MGETTRKDVIEYIKNSEKILVSPIWGGKKEFEFLCLGYLNIAHAMGFELEKVSEQLMIVKPGQLETQEQLEKMIDRKKFDYTLFENETNWLKGMLDGWYWVPWKGGGCFGPLTVASTILGAENLLKKIVREPEFVKKLLEYITELLVELAVMEDHVGQQFFWIAEPVASLLAPKKTWEFSGKYMKEIFDAIEAPGFLHVCGKTLKHTPYLVRTGAKLINIDYVTDIGECIRMVEEDVIIMGNVSPMLLRDAGKEEVEEAVGEILRACQGYSNFVLSTGCSLIDGTPEENMQVLFDMADEYSLGAEKNEK